MTSLDQQSRPTLARGVRLRLDPITGEPVLLFPEGFLPLDDIMHDILRRCTGEATLESIISTLVEEYEIAQGTAEADVCECLLHLQQRILISFSK